MLLNRIVGAVVVACLLGNLSRAEEARYRLTEANTKIEFTGTKPGGKHDGGFKRVSGSVVIADGAEPQVDVEIDCGSVWSDNFLLTWHLKGADLLNVKKHPKARFKSTSVVTTDEGTRIEGTILGVTKPVTVDATLDAGKTLRLRGRAILDRRDFGMTYGKDKIADPVEVRFDVTAGK
jgi:polyisoprenoid-binding protein YceI